MLLRDLLTDVSPTSIDGPADITIAAITADSREVMPGAAFVAIQGFTHDGHAFVPEAVARGAHAIVVQQPVPRIAGITTVTVPDTRVAVAHMSAAFCGHPSAVLSLIGITGTNGKGTTAALIDAILTRAGKRTGIIGTLGARVGDRDIDLGRTTPEAPRLQALLREMVDADTTHAVMEVASHGLALHRVDGCRFAAAVFTNLTQDHLDFHGTMDEYRRAKQRLFEMVEPGGVSVLNADDRAAATFAAVSRAPVLTYGVQQAADVRGVDIRLTVNGTIFTAQTLVGTAQITTRLRGKFNVFNALGALATAISQGAPLGTAAEALASFPGVPGRFEAIDEGQRFGVIVDYAHTPDSLKNVLRAAREFAQGRVIVVFGAGGDRDRTKRPIMGRIAQHISDIAIVTSDNPRSEDPMEIMLEIMIGMASLKPLGRQVQDYRKVGYLGSIAQTMSDEQLSQLLVPKSGGRAHNIELIANRRKAIFRAIELAQSGDVVIIAGKGHEPYQEVKGVRHPFDDRVVAREAIRHFRSSSKPETQDLRPG